MARRKKTFAKSFLAGDAFKRGLLITCCVLFVVVLLSALWGSLEIRDQVRQEERYRIAEWQVGFDDLPAWVTPEIRAELQGLGRVDRSVMATLFDRGALDTVRRQFEASPWVHCVDDMQLSFPTHSKNGAIAVAVSLRRPTALVELDELYYLVDGGGRRLGEPYDHAPVEWFGVPVLVGVEADEVPPSGVEWASETVMHGLEVARILQQIHLPDHSRNPPINAIDVSNLGGRRDAQSSEIVLCRGRQRLTWGRSPLSTAPRILSLDRVIQNLVHVLEYPKVFANFRVIHLHRRDMTGFRGNDARFVNRVANVASGESVWSVPSSVPIE
ncbi:MAG: hypothetical protein MK538_03235 [Planctomycetes bacterium]|nr:hypothetical protein [Planctomycetota bacterium]